VTANLEQEEEEEEEDEEEEEASIYTPRHRKYTSNALCH